MSLRNDGQYNCIDCGKKVSRKESKRCEKCFGISIKGKGNHMFGKKRPDLAKRNKLNPPFKNKKRPNFSGENHPHFGKKFPEHSKRMSGKNHPMFGKKSSMKTRIKQSLAKGGTGIPYENNEYPKKFSQKLRKKIRIRDDFKCQCCGLSEKDHLTKFKQILSVHHIDYNKQNCEENNLITTCKTCNNNANGNKDYWFAYYTYLMEDCICL